MTLHSWPKMNMVADQGGRKFASRIGKSDKDKKTSFIAGHQSARLIYMLGTRLVGLGVVLGARTLSVRALWCPSGLYYRFGRIIR